MTSTLNRADELMPAPANDGSATEVVSPSGEITANPTSEPGHEGGNPYSPGTLGELLWLALPLMASTGTQSLMHVTDRVFLTWHSTDSQSHDALAASLPAGVFNWQLMSLFVGTVSYVNTFVAQYEGAKEKSNAAAAMWQGIYLAVLAGLMILSLNPFLQAIFAAMGHAPQIQVLETQYLSALSFGAGPFLAATAMSAFFTGRGKSQAVFAVDVASVAVNAVLAYVLIFGWGPIPSLGIRGAGLATAAASCVQCLLFALLIFRGKTAEEYQVWESRRFDWSLFKRLLRFGLPQGIHMFVDVLCFSVFIQLLGQSTAGLAAASLTFNINSLAFIPLIGLSTAVAALVGQRLGEETPDLETRSGWAVRTTWLAVGLSTIYTLSCASMFVFAPSLVLAIYAAHSEPETFAALHGTAVGLLRFVAAYTFFDGLAIIVGGALRGAGDTLWLLMFGASLGFFAMVVPAAINHAYFSGSIEADFGAVTAFIALLGVGTLLRFLGGKWKSMKVIE